MRRSQKRKKRIFARVFFILSVSLLLGVLLYIGHVGKFIQSLFFWGGLGIIVAFDLFCIVGFCMQARARRSIYKRQGRRGGKQETDLISRPNGKLHTTLEQQRPVGQTAETASKKKTSPKKKVAMQQIDLHIRPMDDKDFDIMRNIISTASSIILGTRKEQQDALHVSDTTFFDANENADAFGIVCDGMGGLANGSAASKTAVRMVSTLYAKARPVADVGMFFMEAIHKAQREVQALSQLSTDGKTAGTTLVSAIIQKDKLYTAAVGDSRIYIVRNGQIKMLTRDHNYYLLLKEQVKKGEITEQQMNMSSQKEALISYLGMPELKLVDIMSDPLQLLDGDIVLLCSDGLTKALAKEEICSIIIENADKLQYCADMLTAAAQRKSPRGLDNTSVILLKYN